ncbi:craniofacial development 2-like, partial [Brachionus plicatilis]
GFYSRVEESEETNGGVAVAVRRHHKRALTAWGAVNERIIWVKFSSRNVTKMIVSCYAPTEEQKESFYGQLQAIMQKIPKRDMVFLMNDFNVGTDYE